MNDVAGSTTRHVRRVVLPAPPSEVWPWLAQMGDGRAGWYSLDLLERALGATGSIDGWRSLDRVEPSLVALDAGDRVPLGRGVAMVVVEADPGRRLRLVFDQPVGPGHLRFDWDFDLEEVEGGTATLLRVTTVMAGGPRPWGPRLVRWALAPGHRVMEAVQVRGLVRRLRPGRR